MSRFGENDLDGHEFPDDFSNLHDESVCPEATLDDLPSRSPSPDVAPPGSQRPFRFRVESSANVNDTFKHKRKSSRRSSKGGLSVAKRNSTKRGMLDTIYSQPEPQEDSTQQNVQEGKRPPPSPYKGSTPKRRRTLMTEDFSPEEVVIEETKSVVETSIRIQSAIKGKRKDSRMGSMMMRAPPDVLSKRNILRPRNPTPSQRRVSLPKVEIHEASDEAFSSSPRYETLQHQLQAALSPNSIPGIAQESTIASHLAAFSERMGTQMEDDSRKRSVTTQDFLDEAVKIMNFIRNKGKSGSELSNVMESHLEDAEHTVDEILDEMLEIPGEDVSFSRPPSREDGKGGWRTREPFQRRPSVMKHLEKFKDSDDEDYIRSSIASHFGNKFRQAPRIETLESEPSGLEIIGQSPHAQSEDDEMQKDDIPVDSQRSMGSDQTNRTQGSSDSSLGQTTTSRRSETVATIAPEAVAELIPESVGNLVFDREKNVWNKKPRTTIATTSSPNHSSSLQTTEDDPFGDIPDLSIDAAEEARRLFRARLSAQETDASTLLRRHMEAKDGSTSALLGGHGAGATALGYKSAPEDQLSLLSSSSNTNSVRLSSEVGIPEDTRVTVDELNHHRLTSMTTGGNNDCHEAGVIPGLSDDGISTRPTSHYERQDDEEEEESSSVAQSISMNHHDSLLTSRNSNLSGPVPPRVHASSSTEPREGKHEVQKSVGIPDLANSAGVDDTSVPQPAQTRQFDTEKASDSFPSAFQVNSRDSQRSNVQVSSTLAASTTVINRSSSSSEAFSSRASPLKAALEKSTALGNQKISFERKTTAQANRSGVEAKLPPSTTEHSTVVETPTAKPAASQSSRFESEAPVTPSTVASVRGHYVNSAPDHSLSIVDYSPSPANRHTLAAEISVEVSSKKIPMPSQRSTLSPQKFAPTATLQPRSPQPLSPVPSSRYFDSPAIIVSSPSSQQVVHLSNGPVVTLAPPAHSFSLLPVPLEPASSPREHYSTFLLSELSEFTVHQPDERENQVREIVKRSSGEVVYEDRFASGNHLLVKALQDRYSNELFWHTLTSIDLRGAKLSSLHLLDVLCPAAIMINVDGTDLDYLDVVPKNTRILLVGNNELSSMGRPFYRMEHLEVLDVSQNNFKTLAEFLRMPHLRSLEADRNQIESIELPLGAALRVSNLSLRWNQLSGDIVLQKINFANLRTLSLAGNRITSIEGLNNYPLLETLDLSHNKLRSFELDFGETQVSKLKKVNLEYNKLTKFSVKSPTPSLDILCLARNRLSGDKIKLVSANHVSLFDVRKQSSPAGTSMDNFIPFTKEGQIQHLLMGETHLTSFVQQEALHFVETLEIADCGLAQLPANFKLVFPKLRVLNANFNAITSIELLSRYSSLVILLVAGNALKRMRSTARTVTSMPALRAVDFRGNVFSAGWYAGAAVTRPPRPIKPSREHFPDAPLRFVETESWDMTTWVKEKLPNVSGGNHQFSWALNREKDEEHLNRSGDEILMRRDAYDYLLAVGAPQLVAADGYPREKEWLDQLVRDEEIGDLLRRYRVLKIPVLDVPDAKGLEFLYERKKVLEGLNG
jgi:Leucine-rich repeat (LRR) protein